MTLKILKNSCCVHRYLILLGEIFFIFILKMALSNGQNRMWFCLTWYYPKKIRASKGIRWNGTQEILKQNWKNVLGVKCHSRLLGHQMPLEFIGASNVNWGYWGVKWHQSLLGRQMPPEVIGASNATLGLLGSQRPGGVKRQGRQRAW